MEIHCWRLKMKKILLASALTVASASAFASNGLCTNVGSVASSSYSWNGTNYVLCELPSSVLSDKTLFNGNDTRYRKPVLWALPGIVTVGDGYVQNTSYAAANHSVLTIEAGVNVIATANNAALVIARGAKINAVGSAGNPIVFSSADEDFTGEGEWGGVILSGYGVANECTSGDTCLMEGISSNYYFGSGSSSKAANETGSGTMNYVAITEGGTEINVNDPDDVANGGNEINGLTLYGVTSSTIISNIHVNENLDDGIEFFGGDVDVSNLWLTCNGDDSVDWDYGFHGSITNVYIEQGDKNGAADHAFELAGNPNNYAATPLATAAVEGAYVEFVGDNADADTDFVFKLKEGTDGYFNNIVVTGYNTGTTQDCDAISSTNISSADFGTMSVDCSVVDAMTFSATGPSSFTKATTFWAAAPACD